MNPYVIIALIVAWIGSLAAVGYWQNQAGHTAERVAWQARENTELADKNAKLKELEEKYRALEQKSATDLAAIAADYELQLEEKDHDKETALADAAAGRAFGLRWSADAAAKGSDGSTAAAPGAGASERDAAASCKLPDQVTRDLIRLASDADKVAEQLLEAQAVIIKDREVCR